MRKLILLCIFMVIMNIVLSQIYYGKNGLGRLEIINDSLCAITFTLIFGDTSTDTCYVKKKSDTLWITSKVRKRYTITSYKEWQPIITPYVAIPVNIYAKYDDKEYYLVAEYAAIYDSINEQFVLNEYTLHYGDLLVIRDFLGYYRVYWEGGDAHYFTIKNNAMYSNMLIFDEFPLLIKNSKLIPIDKIKNEQCWIDNGFYFPKLKKGGGDRNFNVIRSYDTGLIDLHTGFKKSQKYFPAFRKH